ncbi:uncharacterized protein LOC119164055 [Rhipicephalus microplus]|uniref:uncharacterized protein LOC119164055 n=2 Tax=Rhipicephalus microplus TaxID=6941 RepID=UPI0018890AC3|nr:uncharacterized protein LOC119164055 [Rhipicephalus microplus]XP_037277159.1 uncharacterized protein LOC119170183 [Rhipicephalus microplus]
MTLMSQLRTGGAAGGARRCWSGPSKLFLAGLVKGQQHRFRPIMEDPGKGRLHEFRPRARSFPVDQPLVRRPRKQRRTARRKDRWRSTMLVRSQQAVSGRSGEGATAQIPSDNGRSGEGAASRIPSESAKLSRRPATGTPAAKTATYCKTKRQVALDDVGQVPASCFWQVW